SDPGSIAGHSAILDRHVELFDLADAQVAERLRRRLDRVLRRRLPRIGAGPDDLGHPVHAVCHGASFGWFDEARAYAGWQNGADRTGSAGRGADVVQRHPGRIAPQPFEVVVLALLVGEDVDHDVEEVEEHPPPVLDALPSHWLAAEIAK